MVDGSMSWQTSDSNLRSEGRPLLFSVITPSFNQGQYIEDTILSVLAQNYPHFEHIIIDGGSTDETLEILKKYPHLKWISEKDKGQADALNKGFRIAAGEIIAWLNSDDVYIEGAFDLVAKTFLANPEVNIVLGDCIWFYEDSARNMLVKNRNKTFEDIIRYWDDWIIPTQPSVFFRRELLDEFGLLDAAFNMAMDYELWLRFSQKYPLVHIPQPLSGYRFHEDSKSGTSQDWSHFFPEWFAAYKRHKSASKMLPKEILISAVIPCCSDLAKRGSEQHLDSINKAIRGIQNNVILDMEIIVVSDIPDSEHLIDTKGHIPVRFAHVATLTTKLFLETALREARGFACHIADLQAPIAQRWYVPLLGHLLDNPADLSVTDHQRPNGFHPFLPSNNPFGPASLFRTKDAKIALKDIIQVSNIKTGGSMVSVIIPTFNRSEILLRCLQHLSSQTLSPARFEVIVCDDGSTDNTSELVKSFLAPFPLIYLRQENKGPAAARNMGIVKATGEYVLFLNDDALLDPRALEIHLEEHRRLANPEAAVLGLFQMHPEFTDTARPVGYCLDNSDLIFEYCSMHSGGMYGYEKFYTCNISLRKDFISAGELFDPEFVCLAGGEDIEYGYRLQQRGLTTSYRPDCIARHAHSITPDSLGKMFVTRGKGGVLHFLRHNNLTHHYDHMKPVDAERFRKNHTHLEPLIIKMGEMLRDINSLDYLSTTSTPLMILEKNLNLEFMFLWEFTDQRLEENILTLLLHLENFRKQLTENTRSSLEQTALQIFPVLNFIKYYYDTVGIVESTYLTKLMELDRQAGLHGVEAQQGPSYLAAPVVPDYRQPKQTVPTSRTLAVPVWSAPSCLLDLIPFPLGCANEAGLSENFRFYQKYFQLRIQDSNLVTIRYMGIVNGIFDTSQGQAPAELLGMGYYTLLRILEEKPYLEDVAEYAVQLSRSVNGPDPGLGEMLGWMEHYRAIRTEKSRLQDLLFTFEYEQVDPQLAGLAERYPGDPELLWEGATRLIATGGDWEQFLLRRELEFAGSPFAWWWYWIMGASRFRCGDYKAALQPLETSLKLRANSHTVNLLAECLFQLNEREGAMKFWRESLRYDPLQMHLYLKMHDCMSGFDRMVQHDLSGEKICVLVYCWNKRDVLEETLKQLAKSNLGIAHILMLDNCSTDGTGELMEHAAALFPRNKCRVIHLPTNVGAPAARNWLMAQPEARQADFIAYLDDDVDVPEDWLGRLVATLKAFPKAGVAGSRIVDPLCLPTLQYGGVFIDVADGENLRVTCKHGNETDYGQLNYIRSCVSVMGCCHLFRNAALYDVGEFDIRFSPTQVDDIEHDLRTVLKGHEVIYNGHNRVVHHQKTGKQSILNRAAKGNVDANVHKMITKHPVEEMQRIKMETEVMDRMVYRQKIAELRNAGQLGDVRDIPFGIL